MRKLRSELPADARRDLEALATANALWLVRSRKARVVALFHSMPGEISTRALGASLLAEGIALALPRVTRDGLEFRSITSLEDGLRPGAFGVMEPDPGVHTRVLPPSSFDIIFTPGLAFDLRGLRLGYGKGCYDRVLRAAAPATIAGFAFEFQIVAELSVEPHDVPVGVLVTDARVIEISPSQLPAS